jgi:hypothetical protein
MSPLNVRSTMLTVLGDESNRIVANEAETVKTRRIKIP